jgi:hypothetical protein
MERVELIFGVSVQAHTAVFVSFKSLHSGF